MSIKLAMIKIEGFTKQTFHWEVVVPQGYPFSPPMVYNLNKISHPDINMTDGFANMSFLTTKWSPVLTLKNVIYALQLFLVGSLEDLEPQEFIMKDSKTKFDLYENATRHSVSEILGY